MSKLWKQECLNLSYHRVDLSQSDSELSAFSANLIKEFAMSANVVAGLALLLEPSAILRASGVSFSDCSSPSESRSSSSADTSKDGSPAVVISIVVMELGAGEGEGVMCGVSPPLDGKDTIGGCAERM